MSPSYRQGSRRRMDKFSLGEISAVDRPAQQPALSVIEKRNATEDVAKAFAPDDSRFSDDDWETFSKGLFLPNPRDGETREAFVGRMLSDVEKRGSLTGEQLAAVAHARFEMQICEKRRGPRAGETRRAFTERMNKDNPGMSAADISEAFGKVETEEELDKRGDLVDVLTSAEDGHQHGISIMESHEGVALLVHFAVGDGMEAVPHDHQIVFMEDGSYEISENRGHSHDVDSARLQQLILQHVSKSATELTDRPYASNERHRVAKSGAALADGSYPIRGATDLRNAVAALGNVPTEDREPIAKHIIARADALHMSDQLPEKGALAGLLKVASFGGSVAKGDNTMAGEKSELDVLKATVAVLTAVNGLSAVNKAHYDVLDADNQTSFLALDAAGMDKAVADAETQKNADDPIVYTAASGDIYKASDDPRLVKMAKERDEDRKQNIRLAKAAEDADLTKRVTSDLANLPGSVDVRKAILKAVDGIEDEATRTGAHDALKAHSVRMAGALTTVGVGGQPVEIAKGGEAGAAEAELDTLAKAHAAEKGVDFYTAYEKVSEANPALLAKAVS